MGLLRPRGKAGPRNLGWVSMSRNGLDPGILSLSCQLTVLPDVKSGEK
jgi:hypothetical protein